MDILYEALDVVTDKVRNVGEGLYSRFAEAGLKVLPLRETTNIMNEPVLALDVEDPLTGKIRTFEAQEIAEYADGWRPIGNSVAVLPKMERASNGRLSTEIPFNKYANNHPSELGGVDVVADCIIEHLKTGKRVFIGGQTDVPLERHETSDHIHYFPKQMKP